MKGFYDLVPSGRSRRLRRVASKVLEAHDLDVRAVRLLSNETNAVYQVDDANGQRYVLRVGRGGNIGHSLDQVRSETQWLTALARTQTCEFPYP